MSGRLRVVPTPAATTPRALGLVRVSKERDGMVSPEVQRHAISDYATARGYQINGWLEGLDESGVSMFYMDEGIDTGTVVEQATFTPSSADSFATYPYLHTAAALWNLAPLPGHVDVITRELRIPSVNASVRAWSVPSPAAV